MPFFLIAVVVVLLMVKRRIFEKKIDFERISDGDRLRYCFWNDCLSCSNGFSIEKNQCENLFIDHHHRDECRDEFNLFDNFIEILLLDRKEINGFWLVKRFTTNRNRDFFV